MRKRPVRFRHPVRVFLLLDDVPLALGSGDQLGRQPFAARKFFLTYQDRILFGTDGPWPEERVQLYWRFLETEDEYFPYSEKPFPPQGLWNIYGVNLPDEVLRKVYHENAARLLPGVKERVERYILTAGAGKK